MARAADIFRTRLRDGRLNTPPVLSVTTREKNPVDTARSWTPCLLFGRHPCAGTFGDRAVDQPGVVARLRQCEVAQRGPRPAAAIGHDFLAVPDTGRRDVTLELLARAEQPILGPVQVAPHEIDRIRDMAGTAVEVALAGELFARAEIDQAIGGVGAHLVERRAQPLVKPRRKATLHRFDRTIHNLAPLALPALEENVEQEYFRHAEVLHDPRQHRGILSLRRIIEYGRDALTDAARAEPFGDCRRVEQASIDAARAIDRQVDRSAQMARQIFHRA